MNTSSGGLSAVGLAVVLVLSVSSCGGEDAGAEPDGTSDEPSAGETAPEGGSSGSEEPSGEGGAAEDPESSPTPVPASSDGPAENWPEPEIPEEIYEETEEGALAALRYWFEAINYLQLTGDYEPVDAVSASDCETCNNKIAQFYDLYEVENGWYVADGASVEDEMVSEITSDSRAGILFDLVESGYTVYSEEAEALGQVTGATYEAEATLGYDGEEWFVLQIDIPELGNE
ncbi:DUF6318 family protein [Nesterenkonia halotolerans]|uniref:DUF6318 family protein n=1 Tax=Nesterenkonia halotolerans TaxID=225325 RepID=UPI003EE63CD4